MALLSGQGVANVDCIVILLFADLHRWTDWGIVQFVGWQLCQTWFITHIAVDIAEIHYLPYSFFGQWGQKWTNCISWKRNMTFFKKGFPEYDPNPLLGYLIPKLV